MLLKTIQKHLLTYTHQLLQQRYFKLTERDVKLIRPAANGERVASSIFYFIIIANSVKTSSTDSPLLALHSIYLNPKFLAISLAY